MRSRAVVRGDVADLPPNIEYLRKTGTRFDNNMLGNAGPLDAPAIEYGLNIGTEISGNVINFPPSLSTIWLGNWNIITGDIINLPRGLTTFVIGGLNSLSGNTINIPQNIIGTCNITGRNTITGPVSGVPRNISETLAFDGSNTVHGTLTQLPTGVQGVVFGGNNTLTGNISALSAYPNLTRFEISSQRSTIFGDINTLSPKLTSFLVIGNSTVITGNLSGLKTGLKYFLVDSISNTIVGNLSSVPTTVTDRFVLLNGSQIEGRTDSISQCKYIRLTTLSNTTSGNLDLLTPDATYYWNDTAGYIQGNLKNLPRTLQLLAVRGGASVTSGGQVLGAGLGNNSLSGDLSELPESLTDFILDSNNSVITGDISNLQKDIGTFSYNVTNPNSFITGSFNNIRFTKLYSFAAYGNNSITGNLNSLSHLSGVWVNTPQLTGLNVLGGLNALQLGGSNTVTGCLTGMPESIGYCVLHGNNTIDSYYDGTGGKGYNKRKWASRASAGFFQPSKTMLGFSYIPSMGSNGQPRMSPAHMTTLLVDLCSAPWYNRFNFDGEPFLYLGGSTNPTISLSAYPDAALAIQSLSARFIALSGVFTPPNTVA